MQTAIDISAFLVRGSQYTFSIVPSGAVSFVYRPSIDDVIAALQGVSGVDAVGIAVQSASFFSISPDQFNITFTYAGDGSDTVGSMQGVFLNALSDLSTSFSFVAAYGGPQGAPADTSGIKENLAGAADAAKSLLPSTSGLWAIAVIGLILIFFLSGGASVLRRAAA